MPEQEGRAEATVDLSSQAVEAAAVGQDSVDKQDSVESSSGLISHSMATTRGFAANRAPPYRPTRRPPMAVLRVLDDGLGSFEELRIRETPFDIGRLDGHLTIPHELQMSRKHARIERTVGGDSKAGGFSGAAEWTLNDLRSLNGTFVKKSQLQIRDQTQVLIGGELVRFELPEDNDNLVLVRVGPAQAEDKLVLNPGTAWIGMDQADCIPFLVGNPFLDPKRIRLDAGRRGRWTITDADSTNGIWVRVETATLQNGDQFQAGEQRFAFYLP